MKKFVFIILCIALLASFAQGGYVFDLIPFNLDNDPDFDFVPGLDIQVELMEVNGYVRFCFTNNSTISSSVTDIYFDDGPLSELISLDDKDDIGADGDLGHCGVDFSQGASPAVLPGGSLIGFEVTKDFLADSDAGQGGVSTHGINETGDEYLCIDFSLKPGQTLADVYGNIIDGDLRIGVHVQSLPTCLVPEGSLSAVNTIPEPVTLVLLGLGGMLLRRRK